MFPHALASKVTQSMIVVIGFVILCMLYQIVSYRFFHPLSQFRGPFWASVTRLWITYHTLKEDECETFEKLHKIYGTGHAADRSYSLAYRLFCGTSGPVIRITPTMLLVSDATKLPDIYHRQADKSKFYIMGSMGKTESVFNIQDRQQHATARKLVAGPVSDHFRTGFLISTTWRDL